MEAPALDPQQIIDNEHVKLLAIFHYVLGGLTAFFACIPIFHVIMGLVIICAPETFHSGRQGPPAFIGWLFVIMGSFFILAGWTFAVLVLIAGRFITRRTHYTYCFIIAIVECLFMPFGTALGVCAILVLNRESVKALFTPVLVV